MKHPLDLQVRGMVTRVSAGLGKKGNIRAASGVPACPQNGPRPFFIKECLVTHMRGGLPIDMPWAELLLF